MEFDIGGEKLNRLAIKMKNGDKNAAAAVYDELAPKVFGFCIARVRARHAAEDITQDIFLKLLEKIEMFDEEKGNFVVWFWQIARNELIDNFRRKKDAAFSDFSEEKIESLSQTEQGDLDSKLEYEKLFKFVSSLDEEEKDLFELRYVAELPYKRISEILGKSEGASRVVVSRLRKKIKQQFR